MIIVVDNEGIVVTAGDDPDSVIKKAHQTIGNDGPDRDIFHLLETSGD